MRNKFWVIMLWTISILDLLANCAHAEPMSMATAMLIGSGISAGGSILGGLLGGKKKEPEFKLAPEYEESKNARKLWWEKLQGWGAENGYGAISPDWADIWERAKNRVREYYQGTATNPTGAYARLKSRAAISGMSDSPAYLRNVAKMNVEEGDQMNELASDQSLAEAQFGENARLNWLKSLQGISSLNPNYATYMPDNYGAGNMISDVSGAIGAGFNAYSQQKWLGDLLKQQKQPNIFTPTN